MKKNIQSQLYITKHKHIIYFFQKAIYVPILLLKKIAAEITSNAERNKNVNCLEFFFHRPYFFVQLAENNIFVTQSMQYMYILVYAHDYAEKMKGKLASFSPTLCSNPLEYIASLEYTHTYIDSECSTVALFALLWWCYVDLDM